MKVIFRKLIVYLDFLLVRFSAYLILGHSLEMPNTLGRVFMQISLRAYGAEVVDDGNGIRFVGSNFAVNWGSVGFFGPLTIDPQFWNKGIAQKLLERTMQLFSKWNTKHIGLFTFADSPKHIALYQKFDFWPRFLTAIMSKSLDVAANYAKSRSELKWSKFSELFNNTVISDNAAPYQEMKDQEQPNETRNLDLCSELTNTIFNGLDLSVEIKSIRSQGLGDTVLLWDNNTDISSRSSSIDAYRDNASLVGLAACHCGAGSEAGSNKCYIKFGGVKPGHAAAYNFDRLLDSCEAFAKEQGMTHIVAGVNTGRYEAYRKLLARGFRTDISGVAMQRNNDPGYNEFDKYIIDDGR